MNVATRVLGIVALGLSATGVWADEFECLIEPRQTIEIRASVDGLITDVLVERGDVVKAGQTLVQLDDGFERASAEVARYRATMEGDIRSGESRVAHAQQKLKRFEMLVATRFIAVQERDEAITEKRLADAELLNATDNHRMASLEYQRLTEQLRLRTLTSPINAVVAARLMHPGEVANNQDLRRPILKLADISELHVEVLMPLAVWNKVRLGQTVDVQPEPPVSGHYEASVSVIDKVVDPASGTFGVRLLLPNPNFAIPSGIRCRAEFIDVSGTVTGGIAAAALK